MPLILIVHIEVWNYNVIFARFLFVFDLFCVAHRHHTTECAPWRSSIEKWTKRSEKRVRERVRKKSSWKTMNYRQLGDRYRARSAIHAVRYLSRDFYWSRSIRWMNIEEICRLQNCEIIIFNCYFIDSEQKNVTIDTNMCALKIYSYRSVLARSSLVLLND